MAAIRSCALDADVGGAAAPTLAVHTTEPVLAGPHFRIPKSTNDDSAESESHTHQSSLSISGNTTTIFRVDVGMTSPPPATRITYGATETADVEEALPESATVRMPVPASLAEPPRSIIEEPTTPAAVHLTSRPLSSFSESNIPVDEARPQLVVDRFNWPDVCDDIQALPSRVFEPILASFVASAAKGLKTFAVVGTDIGCGCTTTTLCLARLLSAHGIRTAVVDANFVRPSLAEQLSVKVTDGWDRAMTGTLPLGEVLIESLEDRIVLAPLDQPISAAPSAANNLRTSLVSRMLRDANDMVLIDAGAIDDDGAADTLASLALAMPINGVYAVCDMRAAPTQELVAFARRFKTRKIDLLGTIENFIAN